MDVAEPPRIVVESHASCSDAKRVEEQLDAALSSTRAPGPKWTVRMRIESTVTHALRAEGEITDDDGFPIAERVLSVPTGDCRGLARAVGVWASLVLDEELSRSRGASQTPTASPTPQADDVTTTPAVAWPAPEQNTKPPPEADWYLHNEETRTLEIGAATFLMAGTGTGAIIGGSPYLIIEAGHGIFLRPSIAFGEELNRPAPTNALALAGRFDTCLRLPGLYTKNRGMQLDMCGGADIGLIEYRSEGITLPFVSVGPSLDLRGDLGNFMSAAIRGVVGLNVTSEAEGNFYPLLAGRVELALSWKIK